MNDKKSHQSQVVLAAHGVIIAGPIVCPKGVCVKERVIVGCEHHLCRAPALIPFHGLHWEVGARK